MTAERVKHLASCSWPEIQDCLSTGAWDVIIPCGATEQHGPHLPLSVDTDHVTYLAGMVAERLGTTFVGPTIPIGCSEHHLDFPGSLSLTAESFAGCLRDLCASLGRHGFERVIVISGHIGNFPVIQSSLEQLRHAASPAEVVAWTDTDRWLRLWFEAIHDTTGLGASVGGHADIAETSIMLALAPTEVRPLVAGSRGPGVADEGGLEAVRRHGVRPVSPSGVLGDPNGATALAGQRCLEMIADALAEEFRDIQ